MYPSESQLRDIIDTIPVLAWSCLPDGANEFTNKRWRDYTGLSQTEALGLGWQRTFHPDDLGKVMGNWRAVQASGEPSGAEARVRRADGEYRWMLHQKVAVRDESGHIVKWYGTSSDIEDRRQAEQKLRQVLEEIRGSEANLRRTIDTIPALVSSFWPDGSNECMNQRWHDYTGLSPEQSHGDGWREPVHPDDLAPLMNRWREALASGKPGEIEARLRRRDGVYRWFLVRAEPLRDESGKVVKWYATSTDIEDRKQAEEKLRQDECELRRITDAIAQMIAVHDPQGTPIYANQALLDYTGLTIGDATRLDFGSRTIHPDDFDRLRDIVQAAFLRGLLFEIEMRLLRKDGQYRWFLSHFNPFRDERGRLIRWYVTGTDIEDRKQAEEKLRQDEREFRRITDVIAQMIAVHDPEGEPIYANQAMLDYTGLTIDDVTRREVRDRTIHPEDLERFNNERHAGLLRGLPFESELRYRRKDGQYRWFLNRYNPFRDEQGRLTRWYSTRTDIEDRKRAEDRTKNENVALREEVDKASMFEEIVGTSAALQSVLTRVSKVAPTDSTILISGETGTGKELIARAIHKRSARSNRAFISVNCAAIPPALVASELFGHEKGAFTGALNRRLGRFEMAEGGTLFLDEVGELPKETQIALLRVLQEREFERVGADRPIRADARIITATNRDLKAAIASGDFRRDLFYRLSVFPIEIPPLRERKEDIPMLVEYFVARYAKTAGKRVSNISKASMELLRSYPWPGNVRELQNIIERSVILSEDDTVVVEENWLAYEAEPTAIPSQPLVETVADHERARIEAALAEARGQVAGASGAAAKLGMRPSTLESKIRTLKIDKQKFRGSGSSATSESATSQSNRGRMPDNSRA
jgi:formate hydrogenlyase transcriptional activator